MLHTFLKDEAGATSIEYALIATLISILLVAAVSQIGSTISANFFGPVSNGLN